MNEWGLTRNGFSLLIKDEEGQWQGAGIANAGDIISFRNNELDKMLAAGESQPELREWAYTLYQMGGLNPLINGEIKPIEQHDYKPEMVITEALADKLELMDGGLALVHTPPYGGAKSQVEQIIDLDGNRVVSNIMYGHDGHQYEALITFTPELITALHKMNIDLERTGENMLSMKAITNIEVPSLKFKDPILVMVNYGSQFSVHVSAEHEGRTVFTESIRGLTLYQRANSSEVLSYEKDDPQLLNERDTLGPRG